MSASDDALQSWPWPAGQGPPLPFADSRLDRASELRTDPDALAQAIRERDPIIVCGTATKVLISAGDPPKLERLTLTGEAAALAAQAPILLGLQDGRPVLAVDLGDERELDLDADGRLPTGGRLVDLRIAGLTLEASEGGLAAYLVSLLYWHRHHRFCPNCGNETIVKDGGTTRHCPSCERDHFPRTDPCVIMLVEHEGRILLGNRAGWPTERYSVLAGFVAGTETPEAAVIREVHEESGVHASAPRYLTSQPWPFPYSLMLGFEARGDGSDPNRGDGELAHAEWFTLEQIKRAQLDEGPLRLPPSISIARWLLDGWVARGGRLLG